MKDEHIISIIEGAPLARLSEAETAEVRAHAARCADCLRAYEAARVASLLLRERAAETFEPPPFFQTRVMAALRERRAADESPALARLWRAAGALVASMAAAVALLAGLTLTAPVPPPASESQDEVAVAADPYSAEAVLFGADGAGEEGDDYDQVLTSIYESEAGGSN